MISSAEVTDLHSAPQTPRARQAYGFVSTLLDGRLVELYPVLPAVDGARRGEEGGADGRAHPLLMAPLAAPTAEQAVALGVTLPIRWLAVAAGDQPVESRVEPTDGPGVETIGDGWFARHRGDPRSALLSLVVALEYAGSGLARLLLETLVVGTIEHRIEQLYVLLPPTGAECAPTLARLGAKTARTARGLLTAHIDFRAHRRPLHASGPLVRPRVSA